MSGQKDKGSKGVVKGGPSGFIISLLIHAGAFILAGLLVVFSVVQKEEKKFIPPKPVERPKMKLKKPKVKVKKNAKPKSTTRIVTKIQKADMPDIQLPELGGMGTGLEGGSGLGGFELMPDLSEVSIFGSSQTIGNDLVGVFYDTKRDRAGRPIPYSQEGFEDIVQRFVRSKFRPSVLSRFYQSPNKRYTTTIMMPPILSAAAPFAFDEPDTVGCLFMIHYQGQLVHKDGIKFRFWGESGDVLFVAVDGEVVLNACYPDADMRFDPMWTSDSPDHRKYPLGFREAAVGNLVELEPGVPHKLDVLVGESPGGGFGAYLMVEEEGKKYARNYEGMPLLPIFKTSALTLDQLDAMYQYLVPNEVLVTNGPTFCDFKVPDFNLHAMTNLPPAPAEPVFNPGDPMRVWTLTDGSTMEAEYMITMAGQAVLKSAGGRQKKVPLAQLSEADREYIDLNFPPEFTFDFSKQTFMQPPIDPGPFMDHIPEQQMTDFVFTAKVKQKTTGEYPHELSLEYYVFGEEVDGDNYVLLDHQVSRFTMGTGHKKLYEYSGPRVTVDNNIDYYGNRRGVKYGGYLILLRDKRGQLIDYGTSHEWLMTNLQNLKRVPLGKHFDKSCNRCFPPRQIPRVRG